VDVLAVHEVENCNVLQLLIDRLGSSYRAYMIPGTDSATGQNSALVTKIDPLSPLTRVNANTRQKVPIAGSLCGSHSSSGTTSVSKHAKATIRATSFTFDFVFAHFKAGSKPSDCAQREVLFVLFVFVLFYSYFYEQGQASVLRSLVSEDGHAVVVGDFNERDESFSDASGKRGNSRTLSILKGETLFNSGSMLSQQLRNSFPVGLIDHVLISNSLRSRVLSVSCDGSLYPDVANSRLNQHFSDHLPIVVTFSDGATTNNDASINEYSTFTISLVWISIALCVLVASSFCKFVPNRR
jgi:hypothetical protein